MKNGKYICLLLIFAIIFLVKSILANTQEVPHHGNLVDHDDPNICLTCHDRAIPENISPWTKDSYLLDSNSYHLIIRKYPPDGKEPEFTITFQTMAVGIELINGEITCLSCHNLTNKKEFHLVVENWHSRLCKICHKH